MTAKNLCALLMAALALITNPLAAGELTEGEWTLRLILSADLEDIEDPYNTLGQLTDALPEYDPGDRHELGSPWGGTYLSVIFYRPDWEPSLETGGEVVELDWETFHTDFRPISYVTVPGCGPQSGTETGGEWTFEVRSDDNSRDLTLTWAADGDANLERMELVDLETNITTPAVVNGEIQSYSFSMTDNVRGFTWRLLSDEEMEGGSQGAAPAAFAADAAPAPDTTSDWRPRGWSTAPGEGASQPVPEGLPDDPFGD